MKRLFPAALLLSVCAPLAHGQSEPAVLTPIRTTSAPGCPIEFSARRTGALTGLLASRDKAPRAGAGFHLSFRAPSASDIRSAEVIVSATEGRARLRPADDALLTSPAPAGDFSRSFHLTAATDAGLTRSDVWLADAVALISAELVSVRYKDGTTWHRSAATRCVVEPDLLVLVGLP